MTQLDIDPGTTALVIVDLQNGIVAMDTKPHPSGVIVANSIRIAQALRQAGGTVILVRATISADGGDMLAPPCDLSRPPMPASIPADYFDLVPAMAPEAGDLVVTKRQWGAFYGTDLELQLRRRGLKSLILTGIATNFGVESTARFAFELGFEQIFVSDAMSAASEAAHVASLAVFARMGHVRPADVVVRSIETAHT